MVGHKMDKRGRILLSREIWAQIGLLPGEEIEFDVIGDTLILHRPRSRCRFCGGTEQLDEELRICTFCMRMLRLQQNRRLFFE